jgi:hypothetical protein
VSTPELYDIETVWRDLNAHHLAYQAFTDPNALDVAIHNAVADLNAKPNRDPWSAGNFRSGLPHPGECRLHVVRRHC